MSRSVCQLLQVQQGIKAVQWQKNRLKMPVQTCQDDFCPAHVMMVMMCSGKKKKKELKCLGMRDGSLEVFIMEPRCNLVPCAVVAGRTRWCSSMPRDTSLSPSATWSMLMSTSGKWAPMNSNCTVNNFPHEWFVIIAMREQAIKL